MFLDAVRHFEVSQSLKSQVNILTEKLNLLTSKMNKNKQDYEKSLKNCLYFTFFLLSYTCIFFFQKKNLNFNEVNFKRGFIYI